MRHQKYFAALAAFIAAATAFLSPWGLGLPGRLSLGPMLLAVAAYRFADFQGNPPIHVYRAAAAKPQGVTPAQIKKAYNLPSTGGKGTIAVIDAYDDATAESDLAVFNAAYGLAACTTKNGCFEKHDMASSTGSSSGWSLETALDVEWAHAIAPKAKILLVEAKTQSGANLMAAVDYAAARKDVVAVSMSWGGAEFSDQLTYDPHFKSRSNGQPVFFAASGDDGAGVSWPASAPNVVGVGGTTLVLASSTGKFVKELAWEGSGGGVSAYEKQPEYQAAYSIPKAAGMRAVPDVAYNADPATGYPVYKTTGSYKNGWYTVGGTSAGAPQWAAIEALGASVSLAKIYADKASAGTLTFFRDITSGLNGDCGYLCAARKRYDYVTGLGTPQTTKF
ncbi:MAG TPA: S53 family peptidase [Candidatus Paceibacterota bacterium]|nr:S53 family peptidase [Candidatus Paceibacterota bacterium]